MTNCNKYALVDDEDYEKATSLTWAMTPDGYARRNGCLKIGPGKYKRPKIYLHRFLTDAPSGLDIDHKNRNRLDCRRSNMRIVTRSQNLLNKKVPKDHSSGVHGVRKTKSGKWKVAMSVNNRCVHLGTYKTKKEAICKRKEEEAKRWM